MYTLEGGQDLHAERNVSGGHTLYLGIIWLSAVHILNVIRKEAAAIRSLATNQSINQGFFIVA